MRDFLKSVQAARDREHEDAIDGAPLAKTKCPHCGRVLDYSDAGFFCSGKKCRRRRAKQ